ncbi:hypothetical protein N234_31580 [Ralstonia pickettii DTP0602]|nr:hypothetical protein N234_31580 [Ralstonia pickettii DTP0602]
MARLLNAVMGALPGWEGYALALAVGAVLGGGIAGPAAWHWQANRYERALSDLRAAHAVEVAAAALREAGLARQYREAESAMRAEVDDIMAKARKEREDEQASAAAALAAYRAGTRRLSLAVRACPGGDGAAAPDPAVAGGAGEARAELAPEAAAALDAIVRDGDQGIRDANTCIDLYNAVRGRLSAVAEIAGGG